MTAAAIALSRLTYAEVQQVKALCKPFDPRLELCQPVAVWQRALSPRELTNEYGEQWMNNSSP